MKWYVYTIRNCYPGNWDDAIYNLEYDIVTEIEADTPEEAIEIMNEKGYGDSEKYALTDNKYID